MKTVGFKYSAIAACMVTAVTLFGATNITENVTLDADADWSAN